MIATTAPRRSMWRLIVADITDLIASQPPQALMSIASICIVAGEAGHFVPPFANVALAVGAEWAYLRGIASSRRGASGWVNALNWGALALVVLYGLLWGARKFGAVPEYPATWAAWLLTVIHVLPIAFVSFCAAKVHAIAVERERGEAEAKDKEAQARLLSLQAERDKIALEAERRAMELGALEAATLMRQRLRAASQNTTSQVSRNTVTPQTDAERDRLRQSIVTLYRDSGGTVNVSREATTLGISRGLWYKLRDEAQARGEL